MTKINLINGDCLEKMKEIESGSIDLVLTDPPYGISRETGYANVINGVQRFAVCMDFGEWDHTPIDLDTVCREYYRVLKDGGTCIMFYDLWKLSYLSEAMQR
ncbi:MAG: site-specific DNA-methyltransferase, partial [Gammaproteobacteria bacterium]|nr:site-specific DNA-methyltransferase [Gammaproteobacteria bacterium]